MQTWAIAITSSECKSYLTGKQTGLITLQGNKCRIVFLFIRFFNFMFILKNGVAFSIHWTGYNIYLTVNSTLKDQTCGLCGTFNDMKEDDFHMRSNDDIVSIDEFAKEWLIPDLSDEKCETESVVSSINYCNIYQQNKQWTLDQCFKLKNTSLPFAACHSEVSVLEYYEKCVQDGCRCKGCLCKVIAGYAKACADKGIDLNGWRNLVSSCAEGGFYRIHVTRNLGFSVYFI